MKECNICFKNKIEMLNKNFKCNCSIFICNQCCKKLENKNSIYSKCPQCMNQKSIIFKNNIDYEKIRDTIIAITIWFLIFNLIGHCMIKMINYKKEILITKNIDKNLLFFIIEPLIGIIIIIFILIYFALICCLNTIC